MFGAHHPKHSMEPHGEGSNSNGLGGGFFYPVNRSTSESTLGRMQMTTKIANIQFNSPEATRIGISPSSRTFSCSLGGGR